MDRVKWETKWKHPWVPQVSAEGQELSLKEREQG